MRPPFHFFFFSVSAKGIQQAGHIGTLILGYGMGTMRPAIESQEHKENCSEHCSVLNALLSSLPHHLSHQ